MIRCDKQVLGVVIRLSGWLESKVTHFAPAASLPSGTWVQVTCSCRFRSLHVGTVLVLLRTAHHGSPDSPDPTRC